MDNMTGTNLQHFFEMKAVRSHIDRITDERQFAFLPFWRIEAGMLIALYLNEENFIDAACNINIQVKGQDVSLEIDVKHSERIGSSSERIITYTLNDEMNEAIISGIGTIAIELRDRVKLKVDGDDLRFPNRGKYVKRPPLRDQSNAIVLTTSNECFESSRTELLEYSHIILQPYDPMSSSTPSPSPTAFPTPLLDNFPENLLQAEDGTERPPPEDRVTYSQQEVEIEPEIDSQKLDENPQIKALLQNNSLGLSEENENGDEETLQTFKPELNDLVLPVQVVKEKEQEYTENPSQSNLLGYFTYNGFFDVGVSKSKLKKNESSSDPEEQVDEVIDQDAFVEAIKAFQKFNGFPETGEITAKEAEVLKSPRCGNRDTSYKDEIETFTCDEGEMIESDKKYRAGCVLDPDIRLDICSAFPTENAKKKEIWRDVSNYYFEFDVQFGAKSKNQSHIGIAFDYNHETRESMFVLVNHERNRNRLSFQYGNYSKGVRKVEQERPRVKFNHDQKVDHRFKVRLTVKPSKASIAINGKRVFDFETNQIPIASVFLFSLGGSNYENHEIKIPASRLCTRNKDHKARNRDRSKRYALSNFRWYTDGGPITYTFVNHSSTIG